MPRAKRADFSPMLRGRTAACVLTKQLVHFTDRVIFVPQGVQVAEPSFTIASTLAILLFVFTRLAVLALDEARHFDPLTADPRNYVTIADYIRQYGHLPTALAKENRQFPGLSLLIAGVTPLVGNTVMAGFVVSWFCSAGSIVLFQALFRNFRLTLFYVVFVPSWVASSTTIMSEGATFLLMLTAVWAVHCTTSLPRRLALLLLAGFVLVVRGTAVFFLAPFLAVWWWEQEFRKFGWTRLLAYGLAAGAMPFAYLAWNWVTIGELFPQERSQLLYFIQNAGGGYPLSLLAWPGQSLLHGLGIGSIPIAKKLSVVCSLLLSIGIVLRYLFNAGNTVARDLAHPFAWASFAHLCFHLCVGGSFGFSSFDRYVSHIDPLLAKGAVGERQLRWRWIVVAVLVGILFGGLTGHSPETVSILPFIKPE